MEILKVDELTKIFGGLIAVDKVSFSVNEKEIYGLIGPNGAGKTTIFNCISGFYNADGGKVWFSKNGDTINLQESKVHQIIGNGLARTFQNVELFKLMTVMENIIVGEHSNIKSNIVAEGLRLPFVKKKEREVEKNAREIMAFLGIEEKEKEYAIAQSYGTQKLIELGRALVSKPKIIILDEPAAGMNSTETKKLAELIRKIRDELDVTILLVEHDMGLVMDICDKICVINFGKKIAEGTAKEIQNNPDVQEAYLGKEDEEDA